MPIDQLNNIICSACGSDQNSDFKFCSNCGKRNTRINSIELEKDWEHTYNIKFLFTYIFFLLIFLLIVSLTPNTLQFDIIWTASFSAISLGFAFFQPEVWKFLLPKKIHITTGIFITSIGIGTGFLISYLMGNLNLFLFEQNTSYLVYYEETEFPLFYGLILAAVCPAIFEELAFRGVIFNNLLKLTDHKSAILGSAFLFGLVHFSILSLIWLIPFGILLGHYRWKHSTVLYGIIGHFSHNATVVMIEYFELF